MSLLSSTKRKILIGKSFAIALMAYSSMSFAMYGSAEDDRGDRRGVASTSAGARSFWEKSLLSVDAASDVLRSLVPEARAQALTAFYKDMSDWNPSERYTGEFHPKIRDIWNDRSIIPEKQKRLRALFRPLVLLYAIDRVSGPNMMAVDFLWLRDEEAKQENHFHLSRVLFDEVKNSTINSWKRQQSIARLWDAGESYREEVRSQLMLILQNSEDSLYMDWSLLDKLWNSGDQFQAENREFVRTFYLDIAFGPKTSNRMTVIERLCSSGGSYEESDRSHLRPLLISIADDPADSFQTKKARELLAYHFNMKSTDYEFDRHEAASTSAAPLFISSFAATSSAVNNAYDDGGDRSGAASTSAAAPSLSPPTATSSSSTGAASSSQEDNFNDEEMRGLLDIAMDSYNSQRWYAIDRLWNSNNKEWKTQVLPIMFDIAENYSHPHQLRMVERLWPSYSCFKMQNRKRLDTLFETVCTIALNGHRGSQQAIGMLKTKLTKTDDLLYVERRVFDVFKTIARTRHPYRIDAVEALCEWNKNHANSPGSEFDLDEEVCRLYLQTINDESSSDKDIERVLEAFTNRTNYGEILGSVKPEYCHLRVSPRLLTLLNKHVDNKNPRYLTVLKALLKIESAISSPFLKEKVFLHRLRIAEDDTHPAQGEMLDYIGTVSKGLQSPELKGRTRSLLSRITRSDQHPLREKARSELRWVCYEDSY